MREIRRLARMGLPIPPSDRSAAFLPYEGSILAKVKIRDAMTSPVMTIHPETKVSQLLELMMEHHHMGYPVIDDYGNLVGIVTFEDLMNVPRELRDTTSISQISKKRLVTAYPDDSILSALEKMNEHEIGRILIVDPDNPKKLVGLLTRSDIFHALGSLL